MNVFLILSELRWHSLFFHSGAHNLDSTFIWLLYFSVLFTLMGMHLR